MTAMLESEGFKDVPDFADLHRCVHCGYCLCECPTYLELGLETESPRGRLHLIRSLTEGRVRCDTHSARPPRPLRAVSSLRDRLSVGCRLRPDHGAGPRPGAGRAGVDAVRTGACAPPGEPAPASSGPFAFRRGLLRSISSSGPPEAGSQHSSSQALPRHLHDMEQLLPPLPGPSKSRPSSSPPVGRRARRSVALLRGA